jgi:hypothetical protein
MKTFIIESSQSPALKVDKLHNTRCLDKGWWRIQCKAEDEAYVKVSLQKHEMKIEASI